MWRLSIVALCLLIVTPPTTAQSPGCADVQINNISMFVFMDPFTSAEFLTSDSNGDLIVSTFVDADGDGMEGADILLSGSPDYGDVRVNGSVFQWCNGKRRPPIPPSTAFQQPGFGVEPPDPLRSLITVCHDLCLLYDSGVEFFDGQVVLVDNGAIAETPDILIKESTGVDPETLVIPGVVEGLPNYSGPAVYSTLAIVEFVPPCANDPTWLACDTDLTGDCVVNNQDLGTLLASYLLSDGDPGFNPDADFDGSGSVDNVDLGEMLADYLNNCN